MTDVAIEFHSDALIDLRTIASHYEELAAGLGSEFMLSVEMTLLRIQRFPALYAASWENFRRAVLPRFPFALVYQVTDTAARVIAVYPSRSNLDDIARLLTDRTQ